MQSSHDVTVEVGGIAVALRTCNPSLVRLLEQRFRRFLNPAAEPAFRFDITVIPQRDVRRRRRPARSRPASGRGSCGAATSTRVERRGPQRSHPADPQSIRDRFRILRIVHTLVLATEGGFLLHASSAIRNGRAYLFTGPSGAGKSTIVGLAPSDVTVLTDEISYVKRTPTGYVAFGTPFAGERSDAGERASAPVAALFQLGRGDREPARPPRSAQTVKTLMRNILFFADDRHLADRVLDTACDFAARVPAFRCISHPTTVCGGPSDERRGGSAETDWRPARWAAKWSSCRRTIRASSS